MVHVFALATGMWGAPGCASRSPDAVQVTSFPLPDGWTSANGLQPRGSLPLEQWWAQWGDEQLNALLTQARAHNTDVRSAVAALHQAQAQRDMRSSALWPTLSANASAQRSHAASTGTSNDLGANLAASWIPDVFGTNQAALRASAADVLAAQADWASAQSALTVAVSATYVDLRGWQARLRVAQDSAAAQADTLQMARWRTQAGLASVLDVDLAVSAFEQTQALLPTLQVGYALALDTLAVLTGQAPGTLAQTWPDSASAEPTQDMQLSLPARVLRQRPDVLAAEQRIAAALQRVDQAYAARYPSFQILGSLGLNAGSLDQLGRPAAVASSLLAAVAYPLFDAGASQAQVRAQRAVLEQARVAYDAVVLAALKDVEDNVASLRGHRLRLLRLQKAVAAASNADSIARQRYASGLIDFRAVLEAQANLFNAQDSLVSTRSDLTSDYVRLYQALGGGRWGNPDPGTDSSAPIATWTPRL